MMTRRLGYRVVLVSLVAALLIGAAIALVATRGGVARASSTPAEQLSSSAVANLAVSAARAWGDKDEVTIELGRGTVTQARALMNGGTVADARVREQELRSSAIPPNFCFGGPNAPCTETEEEQAKQRLYEEGQQPAYLVTMTGSMFRPQEHVRRGSKEVAGGIVVLIVDANSGAQLGLSIGGSMVAPKIAELSSAGRYVAAAESTVAQVATRSRIPDFKYGSIVGTARHAYEVVVFNHPSVHKRVGPDSHFRILAVHRGTYKVAGRLRSGHYCPAKTVRVFGGKVATVHLTC